LKTQFANKLVGAFGLILLAMCIIAPTVSATDYSQMEKLSENTLSDSQYNLGIIAPIVSIGPDLVSINYIGASTTTNAVMGDVGFMIGVYWAIVDKYPEVGDLRITDEDINGNAVGTFTCQKVWVSGLDINDTSASQRVTLKVMATAKTTGTMDISAYAQQNSNTQTAVSTIDPQTAVSTIDPQTAVSAIETATGATPVLYITGAEVWGIYSQQKWRLNNPAPGTNFPIYDIKDLGKIASVGNPDDLLLNRVLGGSLTQTTISSTSEGSWYVWHAIVYSNGELEIAEFKTSPFTYSILPETYPVPADATYHT